MTRIVRSDANQILENYLESHGITKSFLAKQMNISRQALGNYLHGRSIFDADFALRAGKALNINPSMFFTHELNVTFKKKVTADGTD